MFQKEVKELRSMFQENGYLKSCFDKIFKRFLTELDEKEKTIPDTSEKKITTLQTPYLESESRRFTSKLAKIIKIKLMLILYPFTNHLKLVDIFN